jgi:hypothetical protein
VGPLSVRTQVDLGQVYGTPGVLWALEDAGQVLLEFLAQHASGDWGEVGGEDWAENERSLRGGDRLLSAYTLGTGVRIWVITEADRSMTTVLLPEEY